MSNSVKLLDTVALLEDVQAEEVLLKRGEVGAVVDILAPEVYEVEFCVTRGVRMPSPASVETSSWSYTTRVRRAVPHSCRPVTALSRHSGRRGSGLLYDGIPVHGVF